MPFWKVVLLAVVQGLAELLPVSSSAHVVVAEKLMGLDPSSPQMTMLLVMLHTGTMFAVILYFWKQWRNTFFRDARRFKIYVILLSAATVATGIIGEGLIKFIEKVWFRSVPHAEVEMLFSHLELIAPALAAAGVLILIAGIYEKKKHVPEDDGSGISLAQSVLIGAVQGLCLPFRGFSRSGATISTGILAGVSKLRAEQFSFALAVILTPPAIYRELHRLIKMHPAGGTAGLTSAMMPSVLGAFCAFLAGLLALKWLSRWLERGRWYLFGIYCLVAAVVVAWLHHAGY